MTSPTRADQGKAEGDVHAAAGRCSRRARGRRAERRRRAPAGALHCDAADVLRPGRRTSTQMAASVTLAADASATERAPISPRSPQTFAVVPAVGLKWPTISHSPAVTMPSNATMARTRPRPAAVSLLALTRIRRGSKVSQLAINPLLNSATKKVAPTRKPTNVSKLDPARRVLGIISAKTKVRRGRVALSQTVSQ
jgi:hypothetical protein